MVLDPSLSVPHVGFVVGKASGSAVRRNRIRRRLRVLVKPYQDGLPAGLFLFGASPKLVLCPFTEAESSMKGLIMKLSKYGQGVASDVR
jgi:ribonuclease P protein component